MQQLNINELKPHPRNNEFFDDMTGDAWEAFKESIKTSGIIEPIVVTKDMIIVSGHQRVRAAKELGISTVMVDIRKYENDEQVLKDLIETNIRQRGVGNPNPIKLGRCIKELEKIYGVREGRPEKLPKVSAVTQEQLSDMIGISVDTLQNYKKLTELIPELEDLVETGILAPTTATALVKRMTPSEQEDFVKSMDITQKITQKQVQQYINEIKQLKENPPIPSDYNSTKRELLDYKNDYNNLKSQFNEKVLELQELRKQIENMKVTEPTEQYNKKLKDEVNPKI